MPQGAEEADGHDHLIQAVRRQIGKGADVIKVYADYRWGLMGEAKPTFTIDELKTIVEVAKSSGRGVVAHAGSAEGMRRAILAGLRNPGTRRRRYARNFCADEAARHGPVPHHCCRRCHCAVPGLEAGTA